MSGGSLLRLFRSEYFDAHLHMHYLLRMEQSGVQDYLVNELYKMTDDDVDYYLPQLSQVALLRYNKSSLHRFLLDKAGGAHSLVRIRSLCGLANPKSCTCNDVRESHECRVCSVPISFHQEGFSSSSLHLCAQHG
ncbi:Phosphatidylinositol 4-kinase beta (PI4K-beta) (PI4Kbeta) (PtdIns 4-kinase beta) [Durusdinium trenchii]|uniref:Phosphatidylinositol 4-kinase beta (PI4K-beta) (PI4Kbeta) (PtdIns 4-kinase beta) n=1 Tax=Durusdinium trenchii TaxID=1381693 RepID=A0ABP0RZP2_9DINO